MGFNSLLSRTGVLEARNGAPDGKQRVLVRGTSVPQVNAEYVACEIDNVELRLVRLLLPLFFFFSGGSGEGSQCFSPGHGGRSVPLPVCHSRQGGPKRQENRDKIKTVQLRKLT